MYRFENKPSKELGVKNHRRYVISDDVKELILKKYVDINCLHTAINELRDNDIIDSRISFSAYKRRLQEYEPYLNLKEQEKQEYSKLCEKVVSLRMQGVKYEDIVKITGVKYSSIWNIINKHMRLKSTDDVRKQQTVIERAKKKVKIWNENHYPGRIPTKDTLQAFDILGLTI